MHDVSYDVCLGVAFDLLPRPLVNSRLAGQGRAAWLADSVARARRPPSDRPARTGARSGPPLRPWLLASGEGDRRDRAWTTHACMHAVAVLKKRSSTYFARTCMDMHVCEGQVHVYHACVHSILEAKKMLRISNHKIPKKVSAYLVAIVFPVTRLQLR